MPYSGALTNPKPSNIKLKKRKTLVGSKELNQAVSSKNLEDERKIYLNPKERAQAQLAMKH